MNAALSRCATGVLPDTSRAVACAVWIAHTTSKARKRACMFKPLVCMMAILPMAMAMAVAENFELCVQDSLQHSFYAAGHHVRSCHATAVAGGSFEQLHTSLVHHSTPTSVNPLKRTWTALLGTGNSCMRGSITWNLQPQLLL